MFRRARGGDRTGKQLLRFYLKSVDAATSVYARWLLQLLDWSERNPEASVFLPRKSKTSADMEHNPELDQYLILQRATRHFDAVEALDQLHQRARRVDDSAGFINYWDFS